MYYKASVTEFDSLWKEREKLAPIERDHIISLKEKLDTVKREQVNIGNVYKENKPREYKRKGMSYHTIRQGSKNKII